MVPRRPMLPSAPTPNSGLCWPSPQSQPYSSLPWRTARSWKIFPSGGGSYKIASNLLGPKFGLVSGSAQVVDYVLTIAVSLASGTDALFSLMPVSAQGYKLAAEIGLAVLLVVLNLRGMRESIRFLAPIVVVFFVVHALLIVFGIGSETGRYVAMWGNANTSIRSLGAQSGWTFVAAIFLRAYGLGGSHY